MNLPAAIAAFLTDSGAGEFVPETWRAGAASVRLTGGVSAARTYVDGSVRLAVPFEVRIRCPGRTVADRLEAAAFFSTLGAYVRSHRMPLVPPDENRDEWIPAEAAQTGGPSKSAVYENGEEEYRASYLLTVFRPAPDPADCINQEV